MEKIAAKNWITNENVAGSNDVLMMVVVIVNSSVTKCRITARLKSSR